jgi:putative membrane protein
MATRDFFLPGAKTRVSTAIASIEKQTAAEIVVTVRQRSGHYRDTDYAVGFVVAMVVLLVLLFDPHPFATETMPLDVAFGFVVGALASANVAPLRRFLTRRKRKLESVRTAARAAFYDQGVSATRERTGVLVYVSMFERRVEVVADRGVVSASLDATWSAAVTALEGSIAARADFDAFIIALGALAAPLARALPVRDDDVDELPNEPVMA